RDPKYLDKLRSQWKRNWNKVRPLLRDAAFLYQVTGDRDDAGAMAVRLLELVLSTYPEDDKLVPVASWGNADLALAYDWTYELLSPEQRKRAQRVFASMLGKPTVEMFDSAWWLGGAQPGNRNPTNWTPICTSNMGLLNMALEHTPHYNPALVPLTIEYTRRFLNEGITADGAMTEGVQYPMNFGTQHLAHYLVALRLRGVNLGQQGHLGRVGHWIAWETLPWGYQAYPINKSNGEYQARGFATFIGKAFDDDLSRWMIRQCLGPDDAGTLPEPIVALVNGFPDPAPVDAIPRDLPPAHWFGARGMVFSRSGWDIDDCHFVVNTNPIGGGHTHADQGSFCLAGFDTWFISDYGPRNFAAEDHNVVLVDGRGTSGQQGRVEAFIRSADFSTYADLVDIDLSMAYSRVLRGPHRGPWHWEPYNPVDRAERATMFIRGASGPVVVIVDHLRKDADEHRYTWLARTDPANNLTADGRRFTITNRYGGKALATLRRGSLATWTAEEVPGGTWRGWLLVHSARTVRAWSSNNLVVNGVEAPYNTAYFGRSGYRNGWRWLRIQPDRKLDIPVTDGKITFTVEGRSGGRIGPAVFTRDADWTPGFELPEGDGVVVFRPEQARREQPGWDLVEMHRGVCEGIFLGPVVPQVKLTRSKRSGAREVRATVKGRDGRFVTVLVPHAEGDGRKVELVDGTDGRLVKITGRGGVDYVGGTLGGLPLSERITTDAAAAAVSIDDPRGQVVGYAMVGGTELTYDRQALVRSDVPAHVTAGGTVVSARTRSAGTVDAARLGAGRARVNGSRVTIATAERTARLSPPQRPPRWTIRKSDDGRTVHVTGDGPQPLVIEAPEAYTCYVNGVNRWFVRDRSRRFIYPLLGMGTTLYAYGGEVPADKLAECLIDGVQAEVMQARRFDPSLVGGTLLVPRRGGMTLRLPVSQPGTYRVTVELVARAEAEVRVLANTKKVDPLRIVEPGLRQRRTIEDVVLSPEKNLLALEAPVDFAVASITLEPQRRPLAANLWSFVGPFATPWTPGDGSLEQ
ncbi:MAG: hypothetical protein ACOCXX_03735, partial [Planctomycetota bacterium]